MQKIVSVILVGMLIPAAPLFAEDSLARGISAFSVGPKVTLSRSFHVLAPQELARMDAAAAATWAQSATAPAPTPSPQKNWAARHPVWTGFLIGAGGGAAIGCAASYYCPLGIPGGITVGAGVGALAGLVFSPRK